MKPTKLKLPIVMYNVTEDCQLKCKHCYNESCNGKYTPSAARLQKGLEKIIEAGAGTINFTGGEPFLVPTITELVNYAHRQGLNTMLNTNGIILRSRTGSVLLEKLENNLDLIKIGLSGACAESNDYIRGPGNFRIAQESLEKLHNYSSIASCLKVCLDKHNMYEMEDIVRFALNYDVKEIFFGQLVNTGRAMKEELTSKVFDSSDLRYVADNLNLLQEKYGKNIRIAKYCTLNGKCQDKGIYYNVTAQGAVGPCLIREDLAQGNIFQDDVKMLFKLIDAQRKFSPTHSSLKNLTTHSSKAFSFSAPTYDLMPQYQGV